MLTKPRIENTVFFSVIIPLFNKEKSITSTVESVLNQTYKYFELIIIDDGSTDNSLELVQSFQDQRIRIVSRPNGGVSSARNFGVSMAKFDIIVFLDADDLWLPEALTEFVFLMAEFPDVDIYAAGFTIRENAYFKGDKRYKVEDYFYHSSISFAKKGSPLLITGSVALRKDCFINIGGYNIGYTRGEDLDLWHRMAMRYSIAKSDNIILYYRQDSENRASNSIEKERGNLFNLYPERKKDIHNKFEKIYYGLNCLADIRSNLFHFKNFSTLIGLLKYYDWIFQALVFFIKVKHF